MNATSGGFNAKNLLIAVVGSGAVMLMAAQLVAKPAKTNQSGNRGGNTGSATRTPRLGAEPPRLQLAGNPPIRELFRPLVSEVKPIRPSGSLSTPTKPAPPLPSVTPPPTTPTPSPAPSTNTTPPEPSTAEIHMLGVVEIGGQVKALLKKTSSGESRSFTKGEGAFGFTVGEIKESRDGEREVELARGGQKQMVRMSKTVTIEGPGVASTAATSSFTGSDRGDRGDRRRDRGDRGDRGERRSERGGERGGGESGRSDDALSTSQIMSLPTWTERLAKLEELKGKMEPVKYDRLKKFMESRAQAEKK